MRAKTPPRGESPIGLGRGPAALARRGVRQPISQVGSHGFRSMGFSVRLGSHFPFRPDRVSARVITAFQDEDRRRRFMRELSAGLIEKARRALEGTIARIARDGYVSAPSDTVTGGMDICHPIRDASGIAVAAMTVPYVRMRDNPTTLTETRSVAADVTRAISAKLCYRP
jgi:DNA-binding IclR family transcriptional regulator